MLGAAAGRRVGEVVATHIIPRPLPKWIEGLPRFAHRRDDQEEDQRLSPSKGKAATECLPRILH